MAGTCSGAKEQIIQHARSWNEQPLRNKPSSKERSYVLACQCAGPAKRSGFFKLPLISSRELVGGLEAQTSGDGVLPKGLEAETSGDRISERTQNFESKSDNSKMFGSTSLKKEPCPPTWATWVAAPPFITGSEAGMGLLHLAFAPSLRTSTSTESSS